MKGFKSQYLEDFCSEHEVALEFYLRRNGNLKVTEERKIAYQLPNGTPVYTDNPELENQFDTSATWTEEDFTEIKAWLDELQHAIDEFRSAFNKQEVGQPKYRRLVKELNEVRDYHKLLRDEVITHVCFCNKSKLNLPKIQYSPEPEIDYSPERVRREELATNREIERKEKV